MYTLYGHEGATTTATFSPMGDFLLTGGADANIVIWNSNLNERPSEELFGITAVKIETEVFVTDKPDVKKLPNSDKEKRLPPKAINKEPPKGTDVFIKNQSETPSGKPPLKPSNDEP